MSYARHDPVEQLVVAEEHADHARAKARGLRLRDLSECLVSGLVAKGCLPGAQSEAARVLVFGILADALYGNRAIDIPPAPIDVEALLDDVRARFERVVDELSDADRNAIDIDIARRLLHHSTERS